MTKESFGKVFPRVAATLLDAESATTKEIGVRSVEMTLLEREGVIERVGKVETGQRGRPAIRWALTDAGRARASRVA